MCWHEYHNEGEPTYHIWKDNERKQHAYAIRIIQMEQDDC